MKVQYNTESLLESEGEGKEGAYSKGVLVW